MERQEGKTLAVAAETLYLLNLLLMPVLAFLVLFMLFLVYRRTASPLAANHLSQATGVSVLGGSLLVIVMTPVAVFGGFDSGWTWVVLVLYFTFIHSTLILLGVLGLVRAMNAEHFSYPVLGRLFRA